MANQGSWNQEKFEKIQGKVFGDVGGAMGLFMAFLGDQTGVYTALEDLGPCSDEELAGKTGLDTRYLREWLSANAAAGYIEYDGEDDRFSTAPEQAATSVLNEAGFERVRRATETATNMVLEARA